MIEFNWSSSRIREIKDIGYLEYSQNQNVFNTKIIRVIIALRLYKKINTKSFIIMEESMQQVYLFFLEWPIDIFLSMVEILVLIDTNKYYYTVLIVAGTVAHNTVYIKIKQNHNIILLRIVKV
jgi:hypothetical protein